jgi:N-acetylglucosaminyldiphosphoundecaprenol N-acetyl-beta-D-mannosaminyltransferase
MKTPLRQSVGSPMPRKGQTVLGTWVDAVGWGDTMHQILAWGAACESRYICICNVHSVITATRDPEFKKALSGADLTTSDGAPIAWALRQLGFPAQERIAGPDLMWRYLREAEGVGQTIYLYGSTNDTLLKLRSSIAREFPGVRLAGMKSPPFNAASPAEDEAEVAEINRSGANLVFVGLGCPKQEKWMAAHHGKINALMIGVGAAFDYHAGNLNRAPIWMQRYGLEWLHRLGSEPRRLLGRYLVTNTLFIVGISRQLINEKILNNK